MVNQAFEKTFGWRLEEVSTAPWRNTTIWDDPAERAGAVRAVQEDGSLRDLAA